MNDLDKMGLHRQFCDWTVEAIGKNTEQTRQSLKSVRESIDNLTRTTEKIAGLLEDLVQQKKESGQTDK